MKSVKIVAAVGLLVGLGLSSQAVILPPGGSNPGVDFPQLPGSDILATLVSPYSGVDGVSGTVTTWIVANNPSNPFGGLSFLYQVTDNSATQPVGGFTVSDFGLVPASPVEVSSVFGAFDTSVPGGQLPTFINRSSGNGSIIRFFFAGINPGQSSAVLIVNTAYTQFGPSIGGVLNSATANVAILGPVPEPSTAIAGSLLLIPFCVSALRIVRKR